jgi:hypothetical protein
MIRRKKKDPLNRSGTKTKIDEIEFDSKLEAYCYTKLKEKNIAFEIKKSVPLIPAFVFHGESNRAAIWTPDFYLPDYKTYLEIKGFPNELFPFKLKLAKALLNRRDPNIKVVVASNKQMIDYICNNIVYLSSPKFSLKELKKVELQFKKQK